jgi:hypothetical protein
VITRIKAVLINAVIGLWVTVICSPIGPVTSKLVSLKLAVRGRALTLR